MLFVPQQLSFDYVCSVLKYLNIVILDALKHDHEHCVHFWKAVLLEDAGTESTMLSGPDFEHWIKFGAKGVSVIKDENDAGPSVQGESSVRDKEVVGESQPATELCNKDSATKSS